MQIVEAIVFGQIIVRSVKDPQRCGRVHPGCYGTVRLFDPEAVPVRVMFAMEHQGEVYAGLVPASKLGLGLPVDIDA